MKSIVNTKLIIFNGTLLFDNGIIVAADNADNVTIPDGCEIIDAGGKYTAPGLIDIHCHGAGPYWYHENPDHCSEFFISHGVTTLLPAFYTVMSLEEMVEGAKTIKAASKSGAGRIIDGLYMEAPYMNLSGSFQNSYKWSPEIKKEDYEVLLDALGNYARVWAIDPNREGIEEFMS